MNIEKSIVKNIKIDTTRNREKDMKKMKSIEKQEQTRLFENEVVFCSACNKSMSQTYYYDHIKAKNHQNNLENQ